MTPDPASDPRDPALLLDVVVPVFDEEASLDRSIRVLHQALDERFDAMLDGRWRITIADNASTDRTPAIAERLAAAFDRVAVVHVAEQGRGRALRRAWLDSPAEVVAYLDVDLSTDLAALPPLVAPLLSGHSDLAIGTRLSRTSRVVRGAKREFVSRGYNSILHAVGVRASDAQCGFKAMRREVAQRVLPHVEDTGWFFDTELLMIAERAGLRIHEVPVDWVDDPDSKVDIVATALADLRGVARVTRGMASGRIPIAAIYAELGRRPYAQVDRPGFFGQVVRFAAVGAASTLAYALLYLVFQLGMPALAANFAALLITAVANTWANRHLTFGVRGPDGFVGHQVRGLLVFALAWSLTSGSLVALDWLRPGSGATAQLVVLTAANLLATVLRFALFRAWVFRRGDAPPPITAPVRLPVAASASAPAPTSQNRTAA